MAKKYQISLSEETYQQLEEYRERNGFTSVAEAIRDVLVKGMWLDQTLGSAGTEVIIEEGGKQQVIKKMVR